MENNSTHMCVTYPCPVCTKTFPTNSAWGEQRVPEVILERPPAPPPQTKTAGREAEDLANILREMEANLKRGLDVRHLIFEAQDIVDRMTHDR